VSIKKEQSPAIKFDLQALELQTFKKQRLSPCSFLTLTKTLKQLHGLKFDHR